MEENFNVEKKVDLMREKYLTFFLDGQSYGLDIQYVLEIISMQRITKVPKVPGYISGLINLRGKAMPVIDMRERFHKMPKEYDKKNCIIVVELDGVTVGLIVDGVDEVEEIPDSGVSNPPRIEWDYSSNFLKGVFKRNDEVRMLLDCDKVLNG